VKGPVGLLLPALIVGLFLVLKGDLSFIKRMSMGTGVLIFLAITAPWYLLVSIQNQDYAGYFFIQQNLMNFLSNEAARHPRPFYYYVPVLMAGMLPWSFFLPLALIRRLGMKFKTWDNGALFVLIWCGVIFLFFSAASSKLSTYILPAFPALSLLMGDLWCHILTSPTPRIHRTLAVFFAILAVVLPAGAVYVVFIQPPLQLETKYGVNLLHLNYFVLFLAGVLTAASILPLYRRYRASFYTATGIFVAMVLIFIVVFVPSVDPYRSTKGLAKKADRLISPGERMVFYQDLRDSALFYTNRLATVLLSPEQLTDFMKSDKRVFCILDKRYYEGIENGKGKIVVLDTEGTKLLISNRGPD
jgi:4-amino-4-deoxy-L-arabinose transferase-like glycosyltransferase